MSLPPKRQFRLRASSRIKRRRDFTLIKAKGRRLACGCLVANWQRLDAASASRLGVITSGKLGSAVIRSRARRLMRETFRLHAHELPPALDIVLVARPSIVGKCLQDVERDFLSILQRAELVGKAS